MIQNSDQVHQGTIRYLCQNDPNFKPISFTAFDGVRRTADCILTACDFLKSIGQYKEGQAIPVIWHDLEK